MKIHNRLNQVYRYRNKLKVYRDKFKQEHIVNRVNKNLTDANKRIKKLKDDLYKEFKLNNSIRTLNEQALTPRRIISVFDSVLTRTLGIQENTLSEDLIVVQTYFFNILEDIILKGFLYKGEKYVVFTASAGQIRTKKTVFIKESVLKQHQDSLTCGLSIESINTQGGVNINKYLAYLALCNSATDEWKDFDINRVIVVDDMETAVRSVVDFIDDKTYEITRKEMDIMINHTDGCGMILPSVSKKSAMIRLPWIKGLLVPFPFDKFIREANRKGIKCGIVKDIYGKEYDILKDGIEIILTKSQFKMWKYYRDWQHYKDNFVKYNCQAAKCNEEEDIIENAKLNYQMLQTLTDMTDEELESLCLTTQKHIRDIGKDRKTMLKVLGVTDSNQNKNYIQQALELYPELLADTYSKEILKSVKKSMVKEARAGKIDINGKYTFICPDLYAFCEFLFLGDTEPKGLLNDGEVYCNLYKDKPKLDCLRSPHLYREHAVRKNVVDKEKGRWFITKGLYTSCHDPISKILMFDNDGDKALVCADHALISVAERNMQGIVPLQYNMAKAAPEIITNESIYKGMITAYTGSNIGMISNNITKIWNSNNINLDVIKWLCLENNFVIDYAKTLYKPTRPPEIGKLIHTYTKSKVPHFFIYAKDKNESNVEKINYSVVNRLEKMIKNPVLNFRYSNVGKFDYRMLLSDTNEKINLETAIIQKYEELDRKSHLMINREDQKNNNILFVYNQIKKDLLNINNDAKHVTDVLIEYLYNHKRSSYKTTLWECFGDVIVENIKRNLTTKFDDGYIQCDGCGERVEKIGKNHKMCRDCWKDHRRNYKTEKQRQYRQK
ncbi:hypothetical protein [Brevibacillus gelatini]